MRISRLVTSACVIALAGGLTASACAPVDRTSSLEGTAVSAAASPQTPFPGGSIPRFVQALPVPGNGITAVLGNGPLTLRMCEFWAKVLPPGTFSQNVQPKTRVWGYIVGDTCPPNGDDAPALESYTGPVIVNQRVGPNDLGKPKTSTDITWVDQLGSADTTKVLAYHYTTDQTLHWADPLHNEQNACHEAALQGVIQPPTNDCAHNYADTVPGLGHLHGGEQPAEIDGSPEEWFTSNGAHQGPGYYTFPGGPSGNRALFKYPNAQQSAPLWIHDHTLGVTRLNVYAGLAGAYLIEDPDITPKSVTLGDGKKGKCKQNCLPENLPPLSQVVPLVLQDRIFDNQGQLFYQADDAGGLDFRVNPQHPYWVPELFGDAIVVNGKAWPFLNVPAGRVQLLLVNGSNARAYSLKIKTASGANGPPFQVIADDGGYLDAPAQEITLTMMPGERYVVIADFKGFGGQNLVLTNSANAPFPGGDPSTGTPVGEIVQFRVGSPPAGGDKVYDPTSGQPLRTGPNALVRLTNPITGTLAPGVTADKTRLLTLVEVNQDATNNVQDPVTGQIVNYPGGPFEVLVNNTTYQGTSHAGFTPITIGPPGNQVTRFVSELPQEGDTEVWEFVNLTPDAHPMHTHLVDFQIINRQPFDFDGYAALYSSSFPSGQFEPGSGPPLDYNPSTASGGTYGGNPDITSFLRTPVRPPSHYESGWKDTAIAMPHEVLRIAVRWAPNSLPTSTPRSQLFFPFDPSNDRGYVFHCHIIDHEDNDMMRPDVVSLNPLALTPANRPLVQGVNY